MPGRWVRAAPILATSDGGAHWSAQASSTTKILGSVACAGALNAWVGGSQGHDGKPTMLGTINGGATWTPQYGWLTGAVDGVACFDATHAWAVGTSGIILIWDTSGPVTQAKAASGLRSSKVILRYKISDKLSVAGVAVRVIVRNGQGKALKSFSLGVRKANKWLSVSWSAKAPGNYRYFAYAKDLAGNKQSKIGFAKVVVR